MCCWEALNLLLSFFSCTSTCKTARHLRPSHEWGWPKYGHISRILTKRYQQILIENPRYSKFRFYIFQMLVGQAGQRISIGFSDIKHSRILQSCGLIQCHPTATASSPFHLECSWWCQFLFPSLSAHWRSSDNSYQNERSICVRLLFLADLVSFLCLIRVSSSWLWWI